MADFQRFGVFRGGVPLPRPRHRRKLDDNELPAFVAIAFDQLECAGSNQVLVVLFADALGRERAVATDQILVENFEFGNDISRHFSAATRQIFLRQHLALFHRRLVEGVDTDQLRSDDRLQHEVHQQFAETFLVDAR